MKQLNDKFAERVTKLAPEHFISFAAWLKVRVLTEELDKESKMAVARDYYEILIDVIEAYEAKPRRERKEIVFTLGKILKAEAQEAKDNGSTTEHLAED